MFTSKQIVYVVYLELLIDVRLVDHRVQHVEDLENVPDAGVVLQHVDLVVGLLLQLGPELLERLELVDELVDDLPEPEVGQLQPHGFVRAQDVVEEVAVVVVRLEALLDAGAAGDPGVDMPVVELLVQREEELIVVHVGRHDFRLRPRRRAEELLGQLGPRVLVQVGDLEDVVAGVDDVPEVHEELLHRLRDVLVELLALLLLLLELPVQHGVAGVAVAVVVVVIVVVLVVHLDADAKPERERKAGVAL